MSALFVTGGRGFIGRRFVRGLEAGRWENVVCLSRSAGAIAAGVPVQVVTGDLLDVERYAKALAGCDTVVHLAAVTGKAPPAEYGRVNVEGTRAVLAACRDAGVARFLYVSSIAARFADRSRYPYAESKRQAEELVRASGLPFTIVRPTIVIGKGGDAWANLARLAALPVIPVLGERTRIQPIYVDDVAACLQALLSRPSFGNETIELGGPEVTTFGELLREAHYLQWGRQPWSVAVPARAVASALAAVEDVTGNRLPVSAGQLAAFQNDGTVDPSLVPALLPPRRGVREMLRLVLDEGREEPAEMTAGAVAGQDVLAAECRTFTAYLTGQEPDPYVVAKYCQAHAAGNILHGGVSDAFDGLLLRLARRNRIGIGMVDLYTALFFKHALVRRKLVLLLAILESSPATFAYFDSTDSENTLTLGAMAVQRGLAGAGLLLLAAVFILPAHLRLRATGRHGVRQAPGG
jgi:nucleoside-diphosphate-sugar epimerase